ncbi:DUF6526 family protein [Pedobacter sp. SYP-B3415]|uniref:DUF6526 family protein n=1 Tax=Pedobacter sp. SYP-B3415 TaxID=2496641 RepID=UPI00101CCBA9|nr:DUF6526 family protein [Pedobacter sp. SYP-B3415]
MAQNYKNHRRFSPPFHFVLVPVSLIAMIISIAGGWEDIGLKWMYTLIFFLILLAAYCLRTFALKVQDRAIRAEENLRYFMLTGERLPETLKLGQVLALRFSADEELPALTKRAITENLSANKIKQAVTHWREDKLRA